MIEIEAWYDRAWTFDLPPHAFPAVLERLRGTPARAAELTGAYAEDVLGARHGGGWSAKEHIAHLDDLAELDERRLTEFLEGVERLSGADPQNAATERARHGARPMADILDGLARRRAELVRRLEALTLEDVVRTSEHPRLRQSLRLVDWAVFVADHDDHHLAKAREALRRQG